MTYFTENQAYAFGIDLSVYNVVPKPRQEPDFEQIAAHVPEVTFVGLRTGQSWGYSDSMFRRYYDLAEQAGLCVLPYHVVFPGEPALKQMNALLDILTGVDLDAVRLVLDVELVHNQSRAMITNTTLLCLELLKSETGRFPILYSRAGWVNQYLHICDLPKVDWWLAQYRWRKPFPAYPPESPCPPQLPHGVNRWLIHQTAERGPAIGGGSSYMDYNRWCGSKTDLWAYFGRQAEPAAREVRQPAPPRVSRLEQDALLMAEA